MLSRDQCFEDCQNSPWLLTAFRFQNDGLVVLPQFISDISVKGWLLLAQADNTAEGVAESAPTDPAAAEPGGLDPAALDPAAGGQPAGGAGNFFVEFFGNPLNLILISGILFIMLVLRPQQKQMKEMQKKLAGLKKNDRVVTGSGIHGTVVQASADEPVVTLRIDDNTGARMTVNRDAISKILSADTKDSKD